jgi:hypothetical protein
VQRAGHDAVARTVGVGADVDENGAALHGRLRGFRLESLDPGGRLLDEIVNRAPRP